MLEQFVSVIGENRFGVKLHSDKRVLLVPHRHDLIGFARGGLSPRGDVETIGQGLTSDHQRVIARRLERILESAEDTVPPMVNHRSLAVHDVLRCAPLHRRKPGR